MKFLGTAGARFVMISQLRGSGGIWLSYKGSNILIDPGPGSVVSCAKSRPKLDPKKLDAIILTHRHLDHSNDINVMIEAMTNGGRNKKGLVFLPKDAISKDPVVLKYAQNLIGSIKILKEGKRFSVGNISFETPKQLDHSVMTFGIRFTLGKKTISLVSDTGYFQGLEKYFKADVIILNVVLRQSRSDIKHLSLSDASKIIANIRPKKAILTHFGMTMLKPKPGLLVKNIKKQVRCELIAAHDGMKLKI